MIVTILRSIGAIAAGIIVASILIVAVEFFSTIVHPFPDDFDGTPEEMARHVELYPAWVLAVVAVSWGGTALAGTWMAGWLGNRGCALFVGLFLLAAVILNISMLPYPLWFSIASPMLIALGGTVGYRLPARSAAAPASAAD